MKRLGRSVPGFQFGMRNLKLEPTKRIPNHQKHGEKIKSAIIIELPSNGHQMTWLLEATGHCWTWTCCKTRFPITSPWDTRNTWRVIGNSVQQTQSSWGHQTMKSVGLNASCATVNCNRWLDKSETQRALIVNDLEEAKRVQMCWSKTFVAVGFRRNRLLKFFKKVQISFRIFPRTFGRIHHEEDAREKNP